MIDITGIDKAEILKRLYDNSKPMGMGVLQATPEPMNIDLARCLLKTETYFDYLIGRVMKVDLSGDELYEEKYDRDNGLGAARLAIGDLIKEINDES